jgi:hypothetical protein
VSQPAGHDYRVPIPEVIHHILNRTAGVLGRVLPAGWGFTVLLFEYNHGDEPGRDYAMSYISSAQRADMLKAMQEFIQKQSS